VQPRQKDPILTEKKLGTMVPVILATWQDSSPGQPGHKCQTPSQK
jgi:hypothetical protein